MALYFRHTNKRFHSSNCGIGLGQLLLIFDVDNGHENVCGSFLQLTTEGNKIEI